MTLQSKLDKLLSRDGVREWVLIETDYSDLTHIIKRQNPPNTITWQEIRKACLNVENKRESNPVPYDVIDDAYVERLENIIRAVGPLVEIIEDLNLNCEECDGDSEYDKCTYCLAREALTNFTKAIDQESGG